MHTEVHGDEEYAKLNVTKNDFEFWVMKPYWQPSWIIELSH